MGVYISNMSKPKSCYLCTFRIIDPTDGSVCGCVVGHIQGIPLDQDRADDCPLIEIVRCADCKYWTDDMSGNMWCEHAIGGLTEPTDFCSYGERANATQHTQCVESVEQEEWIDWREEQEYEDRWGRRADE